MREADTVFSGTKDNIQRILFQRSVLAKNNEMDQIIDLGGDIECFLAYRTTMYLS